MVKIAGLTDSLLCILRSLEDDGTRSLGSAIRTDIDVGANNISGRAKQVL